MRNFHDKVKEHLGIYKTKELNISKKGIFKYKEEDYYHDHILPSDAKEFNIMEPYRHDFYSSDYSKISFHKYFHHMNSSQAMCINFFYPLIKEQQLDRIPSMLNIPGGVRYNVENTCFEKVSELEESFTKKTNFDFYMKLNSDIDLFFEIKYYEKEFGKGEKNQEHRQKFQDTYWPILNANPAIKDCFKNEDAFLDNYQIMRNLIHINPSSYVTFILPEENLKIKKQAMLAKKDMIESGWESHFILLTWEELMDKMISLRTPQELVDYYREFRKKYLEY
jgi:hypothetical protein